VLTGALAGELCLVEAWPAQECPANNARSSGLANNPTTGIGDVGVPFGAAADAAALIADVAVAVVAGVAFMADKFRSIKVG